MRKFNEKTIRFLKKNPEKNCKSKQPGSFFKTSNKRKLPKIRALALFLGESYETEIFCNGGLFAFGRLFFRAHR
jgi:hypothetical protein